MSNFKIPPSGLWRYPAASNSSQTAFSLTAGFKVATVTNPLEIFPLEGAQGVEIAFGATESAGDNDAFNYQLWIVNYTYGTSGTAPTGMEINCFGYGTATLSAATFIGGVAAGATGRMADTLTWTRTLVGGSPEGPGTVIETAYGVTGAPYNPESDIPAKLYLPHLGWAEGLIIEFDNATAPASGSPAGMFALIGRK